MNSKYKRYKNRIKRHQDKHELINEYRENEIVGPEIVDIIDVDELNKISMEETDKLIDAMYEKEKL